MYINFWKQTFDYKSKSKLSHFLINLVINILILLFILFIGLFVTIDQENIISLIYNIALILMLFPSLAMLIRVIRNYTK